jgi:hypothetical protein
MTYTGDITVDFLTVSAVEYAKEEGQELPEDTIYTAKLIVARHLAQLAKEYTENPAPLKDEQQ